MSIARFKIDKPDGLEATVTMRMTVENWRKAREALVKGREGYYGPAQWLIDSLDEVIKQVDETYYSDTTEPKSK